MDKPYQEWLREAATSNSYQGSGFGSMMERADWLTQADIDRPNQKPALYVSWWQAVKSICWALTASALAIIACYLGWQVFKIIVGW